MKEEINAYNFLKGQNIPNRHREKYGAENEKDNMGSRIESYRMAKVKNLILMQ